MGNCAAFRWPGKTEQGADTARRARLHFAQVEEVHPVDSDESCKGAGAGNTKAALVGAAWKMRTDDAKERIATMAERRDVGKR